MCMEVICDDVRPQASVVSRSHSEFRVSGPVLYKLDISWPKNPEHFTGQVFGVAVNHVAGLVYVAQVSEHCFSQFWGERGRI